MYQFISQAIIYFKQSTVNEDNITIVLQ